MNKMILAGLFSLAIFATSINAHATEASFNCTPIEVASIYNPNGTSAARIHVRCSSTVYDGGRYIRFFAVPWSNADRADRFLTMASTAMVSGRSLRVTFVKGDTSGNSWGCSLTDCRQAMAVSLY